MKNYNTIYYLLFVLLIMGAFASMAQNNYGIIILGLVAISFALVFGYQLVDTDKSQKRPTGLNQLELVSLAVCSLILAMRVFYIHFAYVEYIFAAAITVLVVCYILKMFQKYAEVLPENRNMALIILTFYMALICYLLSLLGIPFSSSLAFISGLVAVAFSIIFIVAGLLAGKFFINGQTRTVFGKVLRIKDRSVLLLSLFFLFTLYTALTRYNVLPPVYSEALPQAYFKLVSEAESNKPMADSARIQSKDFKAGFDEFVSRNNNKK